jgi:Flp pilus assembly pilin Flp
MNTTAVVTTIRSVFVRFLRDTRGQDLVEYALLAAFIGVAGYIVLGALSGDIFTAYDSWIDPAAGTPALWEPADPAVSAGGS